MRYLLLGGAAYVAVPLNIIDFSRWKLPLIESIEIFIILLTVAVAFGDSGALNAKFANDFTIVYNKLISMRRTVLVCDNSQFRDGGDTGDDDRSISPNCVI